MQSKIRQQQLNKFTNLVVNKNSSNVEASSSHMEWKSSKKRKKNTRFKRRSNKFKLLKQEHPNYPCLLIGSNSGVFFLQVISCHWILTTVYWVTLGNRVHYRVSSRLKRRVRKYQNGQPSVKQKNQKNRKLFPSLEIPTKITVNLKVLPANTGSCHSAKLATNLVVYPCTPQAILILELWLMN